VTTDRAKLQVVRSVTLLYGLYSLSNGTYMLSGGPPEVFAPFNPVPASPRIERWPGGLIVAPSVTIPAGTLNLQKSWGRHLVITGISLELAWLLLESVMLLHLGHTDSPAADLPYFELLILLALFALNILLARSNRELSSGPSATGPDCNQPPAP
jgi:hypothetical protein